MTALRKLGFKTGWIYETIVTTRSAKEGDAAPMGVWSADRKSLKLLIHKTARTYENICREKRFAVNFPDDVGRFYDAILRRSKLRTDGDSLFLRGCPAALEAEVTSLEDRGDSVEVTARILSYRIEETPQLINRAEYLALDSLIAYTKLKYVSPDERRMLSERMRENLRVIRRTAPNSELQDLAERLQD